VEKELNQRGFDSDAGNFEIQGAQRAEVKKKQELLLKLESRLLLFHNLPHDKYLAHVKLEEKRMELQELENELMESLQCIDASGTS